MKIVLPPLLRTALLCPLLCLLWLAFPGLAAAAAQPCPMHAHAGLQATMRDAPMPMAGMQAQAASAAAPACHAAHDGHGGHGAHEHGRCSACPACCAGVAPAPALAAATAGPGPAHVAIPFRAGHLPSVDPALPERPPRPAFA